MAKLTTHQINVDTGYVYARYSMVLACLPTFYLLKDPVLSVSMGMGMSMFLDMGMAKYSLSKAYGCVRIWGRIWLWHRWKIPEY